MTDDPRVPDGPAPAPDDAALVRLRRHADRTARPRLSVPSLQEAPAAPPPGPTVAAGPQDRARVTVAGLLALVASVALGAAAAFAQQPRGGEPVTAQRPGTCHRALDIEELVAVPSDSGPPVPCTEPHETETLWVERVTGPLAEARTRPNSQLLNTLLRDRCADADRIRAYLGATPSDVTWGLALHPRFPRAEEWAQGARQLVCQASAGVGRPGGPTTTTPLAGIMATRASVRFRLCLSAGTNLTCDQPHTAEATSPDVLLPAGPWPGAQEAAAQAQAACRPVVDAYLGAPLATRPELTVLTDGLDEAGWDDGDRSANCYLVYRDGRTTRTTLRGGLT